MVESSVGGEAGKATTLGLPHLRIYKIEKKDLLPLLSR